MKIVLTDDVFKAAASDKESASATLLMMVEEGMMKPLYSDATLKVSSAASERAEAVLKKGKKVGSSEGKNPFLAVAKTGRADMIATLDGKLLEQGTYEDIPVVKPENAVDLITEMAEFGGF